MTSIASMLASVVGDNGDSGDRQPRHGPGRPLGQASRWGPGDDYQLRELAVVPSSPFDAVHRGPPKCREQKGVPTVPAVPTRAT